MQKKADILISIVVPTRANNFAQLEKLFNALSAQTIQDFELILVCDRRFEKNEWADFEEFVKRQALPDEKVRLFSHLNSDFIPQSAGGASYVRNFGILQAK